MSVHPSPLDRYTSSPSTPPNSLCCMVDDWRYLTFAIMLNIMLEQLLKAQKQILNGPESREDGSRLRLTEKTSQVIWC
jgi:hypothetical protein